MSSSAIGQGAGGEIQLTDGIARLLQREPVYAHRFSGRRFDCGNKLGYLQATVELSLAHPTLGKDFRAYLKQHRRHARRLTPLPRVTLVTLRRGARDLSRSCMSHNATQPTHQ